MANIKALNNDYVRFYIESDLYGKTLLKYEPGNWVDDNLELDRSDNHGIFNKFSESLSFYKNAKTEIENVFRTGGNNVSLFLIKEELEDVDGTVRFVEKYRGRADWETKVTKKEKLELRFNSNELEDLIKANQDDVFELGRLKTIDDEDMKPLKLYKTKLEGRTLVSLSSSSIIDDDKNQWVETEWLNNNVGPVIKTKIISQGFDRHSSVDLNAFGNVEPTIMFFTDSVAQEIDQELDIKIKIDGDFYFDYELSEGAFAGNLGGVLVVQLYKFKRVNGVYVETEETVLYQGTGVNPDDGGSIYNFKTINNTFFHNVNVSWDEGLFIRTGFIPDFGPNFQYTISYRNNMFIREFDISFNAKSFVEPSIDLSCIFVHDAFDRLINIISNKEKLVYSKYFGKIEDGYTEDGEGGLIGLISGYWIRAFDESSEKYKSIQLSFKDLLESTNAMFNIGMGTQLINNKTIVRIEEVKFFYQNQVVVDLGYVKNITRKYDKKLYFSGLEFGQNKGGDYEAETGLDEPNLNTTYTTPDRKSTDKYKKISDIRSDETQMEIIRRKPQIDFADEDTGSDDHNWFLDLKRAFKEGKFTQKNWDDRLQEIPEGINAPETYRAFFFTPLRMFFRHAWIFTSGLQTYLNKKILFANSKLNSNLKTHFIGENEAYQENLPEGIEVGFLPRPRMLPEEITFECKITKEILDKIYGTTRILYKGSFERVPNYYFKFKWIDENGQEETGFLMNMKPDVLGKFKMQKSNDN